MDDRTRLHRRPVIGPRRPRRHVEPSPYGIPGVYEDDAQFILRTWGKTKLEPPDPPAPARKETLAELRAEAKRLRREVEELEKKHGRA